MYPLDTVWTNCLRNLNVTSSICPLGKCPLAPSVTECEVIALRCPSLAIAAALVAPFRDLLFP